MDIKATGNPQNLVRKLRWIVAIAAFIYLYYELFIHHDAQDLWKGTWALFAHHPWILIAVLALMPVNWLLETLKWRYLFKPIFMLSVVKALKGVLMGVSVGLFTPNGIGEFAGRIWVVPASAREASVSASIAGSMAQLAVTITMGGACVVYFAGLYLSEKLAIYAAIAAVATVVSGVYLYYRMPAIARFIFARVRWFLSFSQFVETFNNFGKNRLTNAFVVSFLRYGVFCLQMFLMVYYTVDFDVQISAIQVFFLMPVYFYIHTLIPTVALGEIGIRGALLAFLLPSGSELSILLCTTFIWLVNIVLPAITGLVISLSVKLKSE